MELRVSAQDKEISDDDDDRNHKHRRRDDTRLHSLDDDDDDDDDDVFTKPYKRGSKHSQNGSHSNETWKKYSYNPLEKDKGFSHFSRGPSDLNQKLRVNQQFCVDHGSVWSQSQPFSVDPHGLFAGRGSNSWGPFGLDMNMNMIHHPVGLQATFRPPSLNMGLTRQRCRDFEEQGFCLRGDMCPMEHGMNRIVVEDVQSLSQFNLSVSLPSANLSIAPAGIGPSPPTITTTNSKSSHGKNIKHVVDFSGAAAAADFYDPDQPLWGNASHMPAGPQPNDSLLLDASPSDNPDHELFVSTGTRSYAQGTSRIKTEENMQKNESGNGRKPSQKAQRTLFLSGIPHQSNKRETLISHFKRFGEVIDIYVPLNSERAFVQFSKREEAEAALMSPDAVMGNRFIKLWWANRDNIPFKRKDDSLHNDVNAPVPVSVSDSDHPPKPVAVVANGTKEPSPPLQKKLENLEVLKEELRKKQEMLDQKRNDFRRKLDKLAKQTTFLKGEVAPEQAAKKQKSGGLAESTKAASSDRDTILPSPPDDVAANTNSSKSVGPTQPQNYKTTPLGLSALKESPKLNLKLQSSVAVTVRNHRFKLDNRPTAFKIIPPLPDGLAHVSVLKEHFSAYGDFSKVQLDLDDDIIKTCATIYFTSRHAAEKAFLNGKKWKAHNLHFTWLINSNSNSTTCKHHNSDSSSNQPTSVVLEIPKTDYPQKPLLSSSSGDGELDKREIVKEPEQQQQEESNQSV
ncbi:zinc finger CCCH domain-containing protein 41 isoform X1 [Lactuca sativa]|uniref:C3H1-type domain-containing protein n=2 Tax=Lactuca sativa TaxID=4236 RepID=A0A9R1VXT2_LACSA|nr:zinc finger CCCH domain-containing protein 41 isoform X1 [Lactuca sativa]XP_023735226.1 zinc finger CCCH domain-containing protein 41 isoform X1 [Lactuca sativa]XP_052626685.1 zinc finger CCCH domain-containing protein 41 isoform X1 [Lactuca sativa]KAJ0212423.1 hypothetical protein LSAT_V11C400227300 [Lactuca sativa]